MDRINELIERLASVYPFNISQVRRVVNLASVFLTDYDELEDYCENLLKTEGNNKINKPMKQIKITEATKIISELSDKMTVTEEDGMRITIYEPKKEEKTVLEVGKWYTNCNFPIGTHTALYVGDGKGVGFNRKKGWIGEMPVLSPNIWNPANMKEVKKLLISEAEKRGFIIGARISRLRDAYISKTCRIDCGKLHIENDGLYVDAVVIFDFKTGKWAEIIPEKKPLYTNTFGTEFFKGDICFYVRKETLEIIQDSTDSSEEIMGDTNHVSEVMTRKECYKWISDNFDWLDGLQ